MFEDTHYTSQVKGKCCVYKRCWHRYLCGHTVLWVGIAIFLDSKWAQRNHLSLPHFSTHNLAHPLFILHGAYSFCFSASVRRGGHHSQTGSQKLKKQKASYMYNSIFSAYPAYQSITAGQE